MPEPVRSMRRQIYNMYYRTPVSDPIRPKNHWTVQRLRIGIAHWRTIRPGTRSPRLPPRVGNILGARMLATVIYKLMPTRTCIRVAREPSSAYAARARRAVVYEARP